MFHSMTAPGNDVLLTVLVVAMTVCTGYAAGRIHQWYRTALERDQAYRDGYDTATRSLFSLAARIIRPRRSDKAAVRGTATVTSILAAPSNTGPLDAARLDAVSSNVSPLNGTHSAVAQFTGASSNDAQADSEGRHTVPDGLVSGPTYRLPADRVARAKVPESSAQAAAHNARIAKYTRDARPKDLQDADATTTVVPTPRAC